MKMYFWAVALLLLASSGALADSLTEKFRSNGCEVERKFDDGKVESKVECQPRGFGGARFGNGKEEFRRGGCEIKRGWKQNGEYKEEVKCE